MNNPQRLGPRDWTEQSNRIRQLLLREDFIGATGMLQEWAASPCEPEVLSRVQNDLGVLATLRGDRTAATGAFDLACILAPGWPVPRQNLARLNAFRGTTATAPSDGQGTRATRIAIVSLLFNWPSTGGGTVHTAELARFLSRAGYDVQHWVLRQVGWSVGELSKAPDWPIRILDFTAAEWRCELIQQRVRAAADEFAPDHVIITDSWSFKPRLAEALRGRSYFLRLAAQECLCPLSNVRLLDDGRGGWRSCPLHQLATPDSCRRCVKERAHLSGQLHRAERALAGFDQPDYDASLRRAFAEASGILVVNPLIAESVKPYASATHVIPSGFDVERFRTTKDPRSAVDGCRRILFAGLVEEPMKGFAVLHEACRMLWEHRRDFRLLATADPVGTRDPFTDYVGWHAQADLPSLMGDCDLVVCPTVAEEALGRAAVEAMGTGRPVVASRIGGLPFTVSEDATGLLCHPGDALDLLRQLNRLLDDDELRRRLGMAGRRRFLDVYAWEAILPHYVRLFGPASRVSPPVLTGA